MNRYSELSQIGGGTFGTVFRAVDTHDGQDVAIKVIKQGFTSWKECVSLREVASLTKIPKHPHIVRLRQLILENKALYFVFEYLPNDLLKLMRGHGGPVPVPAVRRIMWQLLHGLHHMHRHGFFHRDIKPENLLCAGTSVSDAVVKICDFGQAREVRSRPPYTEYVSTRWYRAPELLLRSRYYNSPSDMWAAGVLMAELLAGRPVFPGNSEVNQLYLVMEALGAPTHETWPEGVRQMAALGLSAPRSSGRPISDLCPGAPPSAQRLLAELLTLNPQRRVTAAAALASEWFEGLPPIEGLEPDTAAPTAGAAAAAGPGGLGAAGAAAPAPGDASSRFTSFRPGHRHHNTAASAAAASSSAQADRARLARTPPRNAGRSSSVPRPRPQAGAAAHAAALAAAARRPADDAAVPARAARPAAGSGGRPLRLMEDDSSSDVIALARELGVGVSPLSTPGSSRRGFAAAGGMFAMSGLAPGAAEGPGRAVAAGRASAADGWSSRVADAPLSPVGGRPGDASSWGAGGMRAADSAGGAAGVGSPLEGQVSVDTDQLEALLGSLGQTTVV